MLSPEMCIRCKGRLFCGAKKCYILEKYSAAKKVNSLISGTEFSGSSPPGVFVSWGNYPKITVAPLSTPLEIRDADLLENPARWFGLPQERILSFREQLIRSQCTFEAGDASNPSYKLAEIQEVAMSCSSVGLDIKLKQRPSASLSFDSTFTPMGPSAEMIKMDFSSSPSIPKKIDYLVSDVNVKSIDAIKELYTSGTDVHALYKLLSTGTLGIKKKRRLTPTRWAITAVDSNLSREMIGEKIKYFPQINEVRLFNSKYMDNQFYIILFPSSWCFEQLEAWQPGSPWAGAAAQSHLIADHESHKGRKDYASNVTGAYYAARLAVAEYLAEKKRQAGCIVLREIGPAYMMPLGVWVIRETVRNALRKKPLLFSDIQLALNYACSKLALPSDAWLRESKLFDSIIHQRRISEFF